MSFDILGTNCDQCRSMVQYSFTSTETRRLVRTDSSGRPPRLSHSSWTMPPTNLLTYSSFLSVSFWPQIWCVPRHRNRTDSPDWRHFHESHVTDGEPETVVSASLQKIKSIKNPIKRLFLFFYFIKSETSDSFVNHFNGHFANLKTLDFYFNVSWTARDKVTRQCPETTIFEEKGEPKQIQTEVPLLTSLMPYH